MLYTKNALILTNNAFYLYCRKSIGLFRKKPVDPECFFKFVRCLLAPAFWQNMLNNFSSRWEKRVVLDCQPTSYVKSDGIDFLVFVIYAVPQPPIHIAWYRRIVALINEFIHVYEVNGKKACNLSLPWY